jgi:hypothetical protein
MNNINTLEEWYKNALSISSPLLIKPVVSRDIVVFIHNTLKNNLGTESFNLQIGKDIALEKSSWINQLLANKNHVGSFGALRQISELLDYANTLDYKISNEIKNLSKNPRGLRAFLYELYIFRILDLSNVPNKKKVTDGRQEIEGTCIINGIEFLFECRKIFLPKINELDIMKRLANIFYLKMKAINKAVAMMCCITLKRPISGNHMSVFKEKISRFFKNLNDSQGFASIDYVDDDEVGTFKVSDYNEASLIEARELLNYDMIFYSTLHSVGEKIHVRGKIEFFFKLAHSVIYKKFESALKEKRRQHKTSEYKNKIIFIDTEVFPGLDMEIFNSVTSFDINAIEKLHDKVDRESILCITRRIYSEEKPIVLVDVIYPPGLEVQGKYLQSIFRLSPISKL